MNVESMTNLTINSLVKLATIVYVLIQYPHEKIRVTKSCGAERCEARGGHFCSETLAPIIVIGISSRLDEN
jgi:hypothetical protein